MGKLVPPGLHGWVDGDAHSWMEKNREKGRTEGEKTLPRVVGCSGLMGHPGWRHPGRPTVALKAQAEVQAGAELKILPDTPRAQPAGREGVLPHDKLRVL